VPGMRQVKTLRLDEMDLRSFLISDCVCVLRTVKLYGFVRKAARSSLTDGSVLERSRTLL
jgi:hypothetical protein